MKNQDMLSKEWCDLIFEGRNKDYGAYALRRDAGHRYAVALRLFFSIFFVLLFIAAVAGFYFYSQVKHAMTELDQITKMEEFRPSKDKTLHDVAQGRRLKPHMKPGATMSKPEIIDAVTFNIPLGNDGPEAQIIPDDNFVTLDQDSIHDKLAEDLPEEGILLTPTEVVEEMPQFPGGVGTLMKWLDEHIVYTPASIKQKVEGDMEITFLVDKTGHVRDPKVTKSLNASLDRITLAAIKQMPKWGPAKSNGKVTVVQITLPIHFQLK